jgi:HTH-type transcriptional regulator, sugar sensing transcriptional regulator
MSTHLKPVLESLGLNPKEIELYLMLLQIGTAPASALARRMRIPSSTAQYTCQQLQKKGLIRMIQKGNTYLFNCEPPRNLLMLVEREQNLLVAKQESVERIVGELEGMMNPQSVLPKVKFFEGRDGIVEAYREILQVAQEGEELLSYLNSLGHHGDRWNLEAVFREFRDGRVKKNLRKRTISTRWADADMHRADDHKYLRDTRFVDQGFFGSHPVEIIMLGSTIYSMAFEGDTLFACAVQNQAIADTQKAAFELAWKQANEAENAAKKR